MNLAETKKALEESVKKVLDASLSEGTEVQTQYDANEGAMFVNMIRNSKDEEKGRKTTVIYNMRFVEQSTELAIVACQRNIAYDQWGVMFMDTQPVSISNKFLNDVMQLIIVGMDMVYHPENYKNPEEETTAE